MSEYQLIQSAFFGKDKIIIHTGTFTLKTEAGSMVVAGSIHMEFGSKYSLAFSGAVSDGIPVHLQDIIKCTIQTPGGLCGQAWVGERTFSFGKIKGSRIEGTISNISTFNPEEKLDRYLLHAANFEYISSGYPVHFNEMRSWAHIPIKIGQWEIGLQTGYDQDAGNFMNQADDKKEFELTHVLEIRHSTNREFTQEDIKPIIETLLWGLTFCAGRKISFPIHMGYKKGNQLFEEYKLASVDRYKRNTTWFSNRDANVIMNLIPCLHVKFENHYLKEALVRSIHWYTEAHQTRFAGQPVINTQIALETVWWTILCQLHNSPMDEKEYGKLRTANEKMLEMSKILQMNIDFPDFENIELEEFKIKDFPELFTKYRNHLSHPQPNKLFESLSGIDAWEIANTGLLYLELGILYIIEYNGIFMDHRNGKQWDEKSVPWVAPTRTN